MTETLSYYTATARDTDPFDQMSGDLHVDVAIVGGGFTGVATALELTEQGHRVALCEAQTIGWGATGRNGGQITGSLSGDIAMQHEFARQIGEKRAQDFVWDLRWRGHDIIRGRVAKYGIACDLQFGHMQTAMTPAQVAELQAMYDLGCAHGMANDLTWVDAGQIHDYLGTDMDIGGLLNRRNMHVHSLDLCRAEARAVQSLGGQVFEHCAVTAIDTGPRPKLHTNQGTIHASQVVLAGNAHHMLKQRQLRGKLFPASLANMATRPLSDAEIADINPQRLAVYDSRFVLDYYRITADNRLMFGSGTNYSGRASADIAAELRPALDRVFPQLRGIEIDYAWSGMDGIIINRIPQVGHIDDSLYYVQGYSGHGIALSHSLANMTARAIEGDSDEFNLFACARHWHLPLPRALGSLAIAAGMTYYKLRDALR